MLRGTCIETLPRPQEFKCTGNALPDNEIPGSATIHHRGHIPLTSVAERWQWRCHYLIYDYGLLWLGMESNALIDCAIEAVLDVLEFYQEKREFLSQLL